MKKFFKKWNIRTYYGFPLSIESKIPESKQGQSGIALLIAIMTIMLMVALVADMIVTSSVSIQMAVASRDRIRAEYNAKSGFNLALFILSMSWGYDLFMAGPSSPMKKPLSDDSSSLWALTNKLPPFGSTALEMLKTMKSDDDDPFKLRSLMSEQVAETMKLFDSSFSAKISDEAAKVNINACYAGRCQDTINMLTALFSCPAEKAFLESKNLKPEEMAYRIRDYISSVAETSPESGFSDKNQPYMDKTPPYSIKGLPFDTVDELKLVAGWDDDLHKVFAPYLTVYPYPIAGTPLKAPINLNTTPTELIGCLVPEAREANCEQGFAIKLAKLKKDSKPVVSGSAGETLNSLACLNGKKYESEEKDPKTWFDQKSNVFRIEVSGLTGLQERTITGVVRRIMPQDKSNGREQQRIKRSYQILHWKML